MAMFTRYEGGFASRSGVAWTVRILQEADSPFGTIGELTFPGTSPLTIEWSDKSKEEPVCGSSATLTLVSPGDRSYLDLYTIAPGRVRLDVYREGSLWWSGCLDPEFYEEPYSSGADYDVSLTFSDFGILDRLKYDLTGMQTLEAILLDALRRARLNYTAIDQSMISTYDGETRATLGTISVRSDNFLDEDGEASTLEDAVAGMLQPLALKMVQRAGRIWVYDINGLYASKTGSRIAWASDDQTVGVDKVANRCIVTFSQYAGKLVPEFKYKGDCPTSKVNLTSNAKDDGEYYSYYTNYGSKAGSDWDYRDISFTIFLNTENDGLAYIHPTCRYFHVTPVLGGSECEGVAYRFRTGGHGSLKSGLPVMKPSDTVLASHTEIMRTNRVYLPPLAAGDAGKYYLRVKLGMLLDPRYNPFTEASKYNEKGNYDDFNDKLHQMMVPARLRIYDDSGNVVLHYVKDWKGQLDAGFKAMTFYRSLGSWKDASVEETDSDFMFMWYDADDFSGGCAALGWKDNRQSFISAAMAPFLSAVAGAAFMPSFGKLGEGEYIPYPEKGGWLEISVFSGLLSNDDKVESKARWQLFKAPEVAIVTDGVEHAEVENEDVEYSGTINDDAKDDIDISTTCGTMADPNPAAKGLLFGASTGLPLGKMTRNGRTAVLEQLLIGTMHSQFAERKTVLSGTVESPAGGLQWFVDDAMEGTRMMLLSETQDCIGDTSEIKAAEMRPDEYESEDD